MADLQERIENMDISDSNAFIEGLFMDTPGEIADSSDYVVFLNNPDLIPIYHELASIRGCSDYTNTLARLHPNAGFIRKKFVDLPNVPDKWNTTLVEINEREYDRIIRYMKNINKREYMASRYMLLAHAPGPYTFLVEEHYTAFMHKYLCSHFRSIEADDDNNLIYNKFMKRAKKLHGDEMVYAWIYRAFTMPLFNRAFDNITYKVIKNYDDIPTWCDYSDDNSSYSDDNNSYSDEYEYDENSMSL